MELRFFVHTIFFCFWRQHNQQPTTSGTGIVCACSRHRPTQRPSLLYFKLLWVLAVRIHSLGPDTHQSCCEAKGDQDRERWLGTQTDRGGVTAPEQQGYKKWRRKVY